MSFVDLGTPPPSDIYPAWPVTLIEKVDQALSMAWQRIQATHPEIIGTEDEDQITDQLVTELTLMRRRDEPTGFNSNFFGLPTRDGKLPNRSGKSIDQMPDLTIHLSHPRSGVTDDRHDALFYECKVLKGRRNLNLYRKHGIKRFLDGQYAWRMPHAGMIGYIFAPFPQSPLTALTDYFSKTVKKMTIGATLGCSSSPMVAMSAPNSNVSDIASTVHTRPTAGSGSNDIQLRHLWFF
jgi:hypothetical protein